MSRHRARPARADRPPPARTRQPDPGERCVPEHGDACDGVHTDTVLVTTEQAAEAVGVEPRSFRTWARRRHLDPVRRVRVGSSWRAVYDLDAVYRATRTTS